MWKNSSERLFTKKTRKHGLFSLHEHLWCYHLSCRSRVTSIRDYRLYVIIAAWWLAAHCFYTLFFMCPDASLALWMITSPVHLQHIYTLILHISVENWLRLNHYQERVLFFCLLSQQLLLIQQSLSVASKLSRTETKCGVNERQAAGLRMREKEGEKGTIAHHNMTWAEERDGKLQRLLSALFDAERAGKALWNQPINAFFMA